MLLTLLLAIQRTSEYLVKEEVFFNNQCTKNQKARCTTHQRKQVGYQEE